MPRAWCEEVAREKRSPTLFQTDALQLRELAAAVEGALEEAGSDLKPVLDLFCGTRPYAELVDARPLWSLDIDCHFTTPSVLAREALPFADQSLGLVLCTQALYQVSNDQRLVGEMARVLRPGGCAIVTVPCGQRKELPHERDYSREELAALFGSGFSLSIRGVGGRGTALAYNLGRIVAGTARRVRVLRYLVPAVAWLTNILGLLLDLVLPGVGRPALWVVEAVRNDADVVSERAKEEA